MAATAAQMFLHARIDLGIGGVRVFLQQPDCSHDHASSAITALERPSLKKCFLHWVQLPSLRQPFDRQHCLLVRVPDSRHAGGNTFAVDQDGAGAALAFATAVFRAREIKVLTQDFEQRTIGISSDSSGLAVNRESELLFHADDPGSTTTDTIAESRMQWNPMWNPFEILLDGQGWPAGWARGGFDKKGAA
jgi:hypothetical protein